MALGRILGIAIREIRAYEKATGIYVIPVQDGSKQRRTTAGTLPMALHNLRKELQLASSSNATYTSVPSSREAEEPGAVLYDRLKEATRCEADCLVCYAPFLDPLTSTCGHTFCRSCVDRSLKYSNLCPICRQPMAWSPRSCAREAPCNAILANWMYGFFHEDLALRIAAKRRGSQEHDAEMDTPLFIDTVSFPHMSTFVRISDLSYQRMIRHVVENGSRSFGMVMHNPTREAQGALGTVPFFEVGTLLRIMQVLPDGQGILEAVGISRFRVLKHAMLDGYVVAKVERVKDISTTEEEAIEAAETNPKRASPQADVEASCRATWAGKPLPPNPDLDRLLTLELVGKSLAFILEMQIKSVSWIQRCVLSVHGDPSGEPALFPWWFATIVPASSIGKYRMLCSMSARERLKLCLSWIMRLEGTIWYDIMASYLHVLCLPRATGWVSSRNINLVLI